MIPQSENKNETRKRTLLVGGLLLLLVNLGATPGFLRFADVPRDNQRAAIQLVPSGPPGERWASTDPDPATALRVVPAPEPVPYPFWEPLFGGYPAYWALSTVTLA